jgi:hypothetical protein
MIDEALTTFIHGGLAAHIGTRNAACLPNGARLTAVRVEPDRRHIVAYVPEIGSQILMADLESNGQAAVTATRPTDDRSCQLKGEFVERWTPGEDEREFALGQWQGFLNQLEMIGLPPSAAVNWASWPCVAVRIRVTALFNQTPGPNAGAPLA